LTIVDEAHNLEESERGIGLELLLSTIKKDCREANFLLLTPDIKNSNEIAQWLAGDKGKEIRLGLDWWQPNERVIGALKVQGARRNFDINLKTLYTEKGTLDIGEEINLVSFNSENPAPVTKSSIYGNNSSGGNKGALSAITTSFLDEDERTLVLAGSPNGTITIAKRIYDNWDISETDPDIELTKKFIQEEIGEEFPLVQYLDKRIGVHSSALPDEVKLLMEDLMANGKLKTLVATTTIAQGINFPVSSIVMASTTYPFKGPMPSRDFWNMAGRVGRTGQKNLGVIGIALKNDAELIAAAEFVQKKADDLKSSLINMVNDALELMESRNLDSFVDVMFYDRKWSNLLQFISHLSSQSSNRQEFIQNLEIELQSTLGYQQLDQTKRRFFTNKVREYARTITPGDAALSDLTGFSTTSVRRIMSRLSSEGFTAQDWNSNQLFSNQSQSLQCIFRSI
jgi:replicative superfamily II helicase